jgi:hypothetical protein
MSVGETDGDAMPMRFDRGRAVAINLAVALVSSLLMLYLEHALLAWPRDGSSMLLYWLIAPFLLVPPLWALLALGFGARTALASNDRPWRPTALVALGVALLLNLAAGFGYLSALALVLGF